MNDIEGKKVVTLIMSGIGCSFNVYNWVAEGEYEAIKIVETKIKEIREKWKNSSLTEEWVHEDNNHLYNCHLYFGQDNKPDEEDWLNSFIQFNFIITNPEN